METIQGMVLVVNFFVYFKLNIFCSVVDISDLVHNLDATYANVCCFTGITHIFEKVFRCCQHLRNVKYGLHIVH